MVQLFLRNDVGLVGDVSDVLKERGFQHRSTDRSLFKNLNGPFIFSLDDKEQFIGCQRKEVLQTLSLGYESSHVGRQNFVLRRQSLTAECGLDDTQEVGFHEVQVAQHLRLPKVVLGLQTPHPDDLLSINRGLYMLTDVMEFASTIITDFDPNC